MKIQVHVIPGSTQEKIVLLEEGSYKVWVRARAEQGKATKAVQKVLAVYFNVPLVQVSLLDTTSRIKWADITL